MRRRGWVKIAALAALAGVTAGCAVPTRPGGEPSVAVASAVPVARDDDATARLARQLLADSDAGSFQAVSVLVRDGLVLLSGAVTRPEQRSRAERIVRDAIGADPRLFNEVRLAEPPLLDSYRPDAGRERSIAAALAATVPSVAVRESHGVIYLLGRLSRRADARAALDQVSGIDGVKWTVDCLVTPDGDGSD